MASQDHSGTPTPPKRLFLPANNTKSLLVINAGSSSKARSQQLQKQSLIHPGAMTIVSANQAATANKAVIRAQTLNTAQEISLRSKPKYVIVKPNLTAVTKPLAFMKPVTSKGVDLKALTPTGVAQKAITFRGVKFKVITPEGVELINAQASNEVNVEAQAYNEADLEAQAYNEAGLEAQAYNEAGLEADLEAQASNEVDLEAQAYNEAGLEADLEAQASNEVDLEAQAFNEADLEAQASNEADLEAQAFNEADLETQASNEANLEAQATEGEYDEAEEDLEAQANKEEDLDGKGKDIFLNYLSEGDIAYAMEMKQKLKKIWREVARSDTVIPGAFIRHAMPYMAKKLIARESVTTVCMTHDHSVDNPIPDNKYAIFCIVNSCNNHYIRSGSDWNSIEQTKNFFGFPDTIKRCKEWVEGLNINKCYLNFTSEQLSEYRVCEDHFNLEDFTDQYRESLVADAVPCAVDPKQITQL